MFFDYQNKDEDVTFPLPHQCKG